MESSWTRDWTHAPALAGGLPSAVPPGKSRDGSAFEQLPKHCSYMLSLLLKDLGESFSGWCCFCSSPCVCQRSRCDSRTRILHVSQPAVHLTAPKLSWTSEVSFASFFQWLIYHFGFSTFRGEKLRFMWGGKRPFTSFILLERKMASSVFIHNGKK